MEGAQLEGKAVKVASPNCDVVNLVKGGLRGLVPNGTKSAQKVAGLEYWMRICSDIMRGR
jgi:hypothetical protein